LTEVIDDGCELGAEACKIRVDNLQPIVLGPFLILLITLTNILVQPLLCLVGCFAKDLLLIGGEIVVKNLPL